MEDVESFNMQLNLGSGTMLKKESVNFDCEMTERGGLKTNVIGRIENISNIFKENTFDTILCFHVIEHLTLKAARKMLKDCRIILNNTGLLIIECPDILSVYDLYKNDIPKLIQTLYSDQHYVDKQGDHWCHRYGYTRETMIEEMTNAGFKITYIGIGLSHGMGKRDMRIEGVLHYET